MDWWITFVLSLVGQDGLMEPDPWTSEEISEQARSRRIDMEGCEFTLRAYGGSLHIHLDGVDCPTPRQIGDHLANELIKEYSRK